MTTNQSSLQSFSGSLALPTPSLSTVLDGIRAELELVEEQLNTNLVDDSPFIGELLGQVFQAGGKRIRPALVLLTAKATNLSKNAKSETERLQIILAVLTELIHTASLVHDDVLDAASLRRGQQTVNRKWSDKLAVLIGDLLFAQASVCLARLQNPPIVGIYGQVLGDLCAGEIRQMRQQFVTGVDWQAYIQKSIWKTASLFAAGTQSAPILNGCPQAISDTMKEYGVNLGICFQIVDDMLDYTATSGTLGKPAGGDLAQGVITAPAMFILERGDAVADRLFDLIDSRAVGTGDGLGEALEIVRTGGAIEATAQLAASYAAKAKAALAPIPAGNYKDDLEQVVDWLLTRTK